MKEKKKEKKKTMGKKLEKNNKNKKQNLVFLVDCIVFVLLLNVKTYHPSFHHYDEINLI